jgi:hypothetical protein
MLEKLLAGEVLEIGIIDPALAHAFIGQPVNVLEQQQTDCKPGRDSGPALLAVERGDLTVDKVLIDLAGELFQFVLEVDDLIQPRPEQIVRTRRHVLLRSHRSPPMRQQNHASPKRGISKMKLQGSAPEAHETLQS